MATVLTVLLGIEARSGGHQSLAPFLLVMIMVVVSSWPYGWNPWIGLGHGLFGTASFMAFSSLAYVNYNLILSPLFGSRGDVGRQAGHTRRSCWRSRPGPRAAAVNMALLSQGPL